MSHDPRNTPALSRRRFVALLAAGSAALAAAPAQAVATAAKTVRRAARTRSTGADDAAQREIARQKALTSATVRVIRAHAMPPGTEPASIFRPLSPHKER